MSQNGRPVRRLAILILVLVGGAGLAVIGGGSISANREGLNANREGTTRGFLITKSLHAMHYGPFESDCPAGFEPTTQDRFNASVSAAELERLLKPENRAEYIKAWRDDFITGPGGENTCNNPKSFANDPRHPPYRGVTSKVSFGLNLDGTSDGRATPLTCAHPKFEGLNGEPAVDNQLYRALGCEKSARGLGENVQGGRGSLNPFVIEIRDLDDAQNDDHVEIGIYSTDEQVINSQTGAPLSYQSFPVSANPQWRNETTGRIVNGEVLVDVLDVMYLRYVMPTWGALGANYSHEFRHVRLKLRLEPDGGVTGLLGGYRPLMNISTVGYCCKATSADAYNCASEYKTFALMADGDPDPQTGQCTTISAAHKLVGIPAFVLHDEKTSSK